MNINPNIERWIFASTAKYFSEKRGTYTLIKDGDEPIQKTDYCNMKIIGPLPQPLVGMSRYHMTVVLYCTTTISKDDAHKHQRMVGHFLSALTQEPIKVFKFGKDPVVDDKSYIGCFVLRSDVERPIERIDWGETSPKVQQTGLEGQFQMEQP